MSSFGKCKYCGCDLVSEIYEMGRGRTRRMVVFCDNDSCSVRPCSGDNIPSVVMEEVKEFSLREEARHA